VSGNFGAIGYDSFNFTVSAAATVDMVYTRGYCDPTFSLFTSAGAHILTNDDSNGLYSHLTQNLNTGVYTMLVSFRCSSASHANATSAPFSGTDGFNNGSCWVGGSGTLTGMQSYIALNSGAQVGRQPYALDHPQRHAGRQQRAASARCRV